MKITTKMGDNGETGLFNGRRVSKNSLYMHVLGELDELNCFLGWVKFGTVKKNWGNLTDQIQDDLYLIMAVVGGEFKNPGKFGEKNVRFLDEEIEKAQEKLGDLRKFIRVGTTEIAARLNICRAICRRVERNFVGLMEGLKGGEKKNAEVILKYLNRLSDVLFVWGYFEEKERKKY